ncbi:S-adenosyl-L-methionine-dependent methyltransferase [Aureobasidium sp. EXF-3400]|nr:S-adenosyl-L-methionine-dependent methyltransferase [Aureobasidium sp. EXF-12344]KAI4774155.1 S-adenosyl-L-methionine-dependent methyltransferase [Aureobasidium sp. EXF-3400]
MPRGVPRAIPKNPGPYHARTPVLEYKPPPPRTPIAPSKPIAPNAQSRVKLQRGARGIGIYVMGACAFGMAFYMSRLGVSLYKSKDVEADYSPSAQRDVADVYDTTAGGFDAEVGLSEKIGGVIRARKEMSAMVKGHVLEVSCGTARNLGYYGFDKIKSLTLIDLSPQMVEEARKKWNILNPGKAAENVPIRFLQGDCIGDMPEPPTTQEDAKKSGTAFTPGLTKGYDTIVQTMGLCSTAQPVELLKNLSKHLDHSNPDARILLLEHGRSYIGWLNKLLDMNAPQHADKHGCWWNRDIGQLIEESGLEVVKERRKQFGTVWIFELKPKTVTQSIQEKAEQVGEKLQEQVQTQKTPQAHESATKAMENTTIMSGFQDESQRALRSRVQIPPGGLVSAPAPLCAFLQLEA